MAGQSSATMTDIANNFINYCESVSKGDKDLVKALCSLAILKSSARSNSPLLSNPDRLRQVVEIYHTNDRRGVMSQKRAAYVNPSPFFDIPDKGLAYYNGLCTGNIQQVKYYHQMGACDIEAESGNVFIPEAQPPTTPTWKADKTDNKNAGLLYDYTDIDNYFRSRPVGVALIYNTYPYHYQRKGIDYYPSLCGDYCLAMKGRYVCDTPGPHLLGQTKRAKRSAYHLYHYKNEGDGVITVENAYAIIGRINDTVARCVNSRGGKGKLAAIKLRSADDLKEVRKKLPYDPLNPISVRAFKALITVLNGEGNGCDLPVNAIKPLNEKDDEFKLFNKRVGKLYTQRVAAAFIAHQDVEFGLNYWPFDYKNEKSQTKSGYYSLTWNGEHSY